MQAISGEHMRAQGLDQRRQQRIGLTNPIGHGGTGKLDAFTGIDFGLAIKRQVVAVFRHQHMGKEAGPGLPRSIGGDGMAALISVSQPLHTILRRTCRTTRKEAGT